jgi:hypothetical protein
LDAVVVSYSLLRVGCWVVIWGDHVSSGKACLHLQICSTCYQYFITKTTHTHLS